MASSLTRSIVLGSRVIQTSFVRTLASQQGKGPMDYVKQGVDQLGQAAEKVKDAASSATSTVKGVVTGDNNTNQNVDDAKRHGQQAANNFKNAAGEAKTRSGYGSSSGSGTNNPSGGYGGSGPSSQSSDGPRGSDSLSSGSGASGSSPGASGVSASSSGGPLDSGQSSQSSGGYEGSGPSSGGSGGSSRSSQSSGGYGGSGPSATDGFKEKSGEYAQQTKSSATKTQGDDDDVASSVKKAAKKASEWVKDPKRDSSPDSNRSSDGKARDADKVKSAADKVKKSY